MRGFLSGLVMGGVTTVLGLGVLSQLAPSPARQATSGESAVPVTAVEPAAPTETPPAETLPAETPPAAPTVAAEAPASPSLPVPATPPATVAEGPSEPVAADPAAQPQDSAEADMPPEATEPPPVPPLSPEEEALLAPLPGEVPAHSPLAPEPEDEAAAASAEPVAPTEPLLDSPAADRPEPGDTAPAAAPRPEPGLAGTVEGVTTDRLPSIEVAPPVDPAAEAEPVLTEDPRPLARFAAPFDNPEGKPLFAIVLADDGRAQIDRAALAALPLPVTIALDPAAPDAARLAADYRAAGKEVAMLATGIPAGAKPSDLEVAFAAHAAALPEAVAVVDLPEGGFQSQQSLAAALVPLVKAQGRGLVTFDRGLNAGDQVARREAVPATLIFRQIDAGAESVPVMRRYLDRAAFKAAQDGRVAVYGTASPEVITALLEWSVEGRAGSVALAPLTALLSVPE